jgi:hypothetical protein
LLAKRGWREPLATLRETFYDANASRAEFLDDERTNFRRTLLRLLRWRNFAKAARVDALLASDPQARRSLEDCRKLSGLLRELPAPSAPVEFSAAVMQSIERQMLLGPVADAASIPASAPRRRARWGTGAVLMSAAALVLVAVVISRMQGPMPEGQLAGGRGATDFDAASPAKITARRFRSTRGQNRGSRLPRNARLKFRSSSTGRRSSRLALSTVHRRHWGRVMPSQRCSGIQQWAVATRLPA